MKPTEAEITLISKLEHAANRLLFLSNVSHVLSGSLTEADCFDRLLRLVVPAIADWATINVLTDQNEIRRVNFAHADPTKQEELEDLVSQFHAELNDTYGPGRVIKSGKPEFLAHPPHRQILSTVRNKDVVENLERFGIVSAISVPFKAHGKIFGAIWLATSDSRRELTEDDFKLAEEITERAAFALYHMIQYRRTNESLERLRIEMAIREKYFANTRHDLLTALTAAMLSVQLINHRCGGRDALARRAAETLHRITEILRASGPARPLQEAA